MNHEKIVVELELDDILPNRFQPRFKFHEQAITELAESIKEHGVIQPILVRRLGDKYEIIAGERRYKASLLAGKRTIPAIIAELNDKDSAEVALIENVQRQDLTPIEEAVSYRKILDMGYLTQEQLAEKLGKTQSTISNKLRLLNLDDEVQEALLDEKISERHARSLLKIDSKQKQRNILERIIKERLTVKKTDDLINKILLGEEVVEEKKETEIPSIFMNNSVQVEEPAIQSSSAIEFINPNEQIINSFKTEEQKDDDLLDFLNVDTNNVKPTIPVEEINEVPIIDLNQNSFMNKEEVSEPQFTNFEIPSSPIIEEIEETPNNMASVIDNQKEINEINEMINNIPNGINPGFVDVDSIEKNAQDIYVEKPLADIDNLLMSNSGNNNDTVMSSFERFNETLKEEDPVQQNKFFTMITPEEEIETQEETNVENNEETFNFTPEIESAQSINAFLDNNMNENVAAPIESPINTNIEEQNNNEFSFANNDAFTFVEEPKNEEKVEEFQNQNFETNLNIDELYKNEDKIEDKIEEIVDAPKTLNYPADNILAESVRKEEFVPVQTLNEQQDVVDLKTVINTIRNCADTIEKYGFAMECEEYDFEDMYQVIFKIQKND